jgi:hypothetical protein
MQESTMPGNETAEQGGMIVKLLRVMNAGSILERASNLHDSTLVRTSLDDGNVLLLEISNAWWTTPHSPSVLDRTTRFRLCLHGFSLSDSWGSDEEICKSAIFDLSIQNGEFRLVTGDGGRCGTIDSDRSTIEIETQRTTIQRFDLPI